MANEKSSCVWTPIIQVMPGREIRGSALEVEGPMDKNKRQLFQLPPRYLPGEELEHLLGEVQTSKAFREYIFKVLLEDLRGLEDLPQPFGKAVDDDSRTPTLPLTYYRERALIAFLMHPPEDPELLDRLGRITSYHRHLGAYYFKNLAKDPEAVERALQAGRVEALVSPMLSPEEAVGWVKKALRETPEPIFTVREDYYEIVNQIALHQQGIDHPSPHIRIDLLGLRHRLGHPEEAVYRGPRKAAFLPPGMTYRQENYKRGQGVEDPLKYLALNPNPEVISKAIAEFGGNPAYQQFSYWLLANPSVPVEVSVELAIKASRGAFYSPLGFAQIALYAHNGDWEKAFASTKQLIESAGGRFQGRWEWEASFIVNLLLYGYTADDLRSILRDSERIDLFSEATKEPEKILYKIKSFAEDPNIIRPIEVYGAALMKRGDVEAIGEMIYRFSARFEDFRDVKNLEAIVDYAKREWLGDYFVLLHHFIPTEYVQHLWEETEKKGNISPWLLVGVPHDLLLRKDLPKHMEEMAYQELSSLEEYRLVDLLIYEERTNPHYGLEGVQHPNHYSEYEGFGLVPGNLIPRLLHIREPMYYRPGFFIETLFGREKWGHLMVGESPFRDEFSGEDIRTWAHVLDKMTALARWMEEERSEAENLIFITALAGKLEIWDERIAAKMLSHSPTLLQTEETVNIARFLSL